MESWKKQDRQEHFLHNVIQFGIRYHEIHFLVTSFAGFKEGLGQFLGILGVEGPYPWPYPYPLKANCWEIGGLPRVGGGL